MYISRIGFTIAISELFYDLSYLGNLFFFYVIFYPIYVDLLKLLV